MAKDNSGWILLHRKLKDHWLWHDDKKLKWWLDILLTVNHSNKKIAAGNQLIECRRGQSIKSLEKWAQEWRTTRKTVSDFFKMLEGDSMLLVENLKITTRITVCNYDSYNKVVNDDNTGEETVGKRLVNGDYPQTNNVKELVNNDKEEIADKNFLKFQDWIRKNSSQVEKMKEPFTCDQFLKIRNEFKLELIQEVLTAMHNKKTLIRDYTSAYLTFLNWAKRRLDNDGHTDKPQQTVSNTKSAEQILAEREKK